MKRGKTDTRARVRRFDHGAMVPRVASGVHHDAVDFVVTAVRRRLNHLHGDGGRNSSQILIAASEPATLRLNKLISQSRIPRHLGRPERS